MLDGNAFDQPMARSALAGTAPVSTVSATGKRSGVVLAEITLGRITQIIARRGKADTVAAALRDAVGIAPPRKPMRAASGDTAIVWSGPNQWLLIRPRDAKAATELARKLTGLASITDQSDARVHLHLTGPDVRNALAKLMMLDLHPTEFPVGTAAMTGIAHIPVHIWRLPDSGIKSGGQTHGSDPISPAFVIAGPQSYATSLWHHVVVSAAEYGLDAQVLS